MNVNRSKFTPRWLAPLLLLSLPSLCLAQADIDVGGYEADDGYDDRPYPGQDAYGQYNDAYGRSDNHANDDDYGSAMDDGLPIVYAGDGMRVSIDRVDDTGTYASGTATLGNAAPMRFDVEMQLGEYGNLSVGQIQTPSGPQPFRAWDQDEAVTIAEFDGRRYRLTFQENDDGGTQERGYDDSYGSARQQPAPRVDDNNGKQSGAPREAPSPGPKLPLNSASPKTVELVLHKLGGTHTLLAPRGWKVEGGAWQPPVQAYSWMPSRLITATGPDGSSVRFKPNFSAIYQRIAAVQPAQPGSLNEASGLINMPMPGSSSEWARWVEQDSIRAAYPDARDIRVGEVRTDPVLTERLRRLYAPMTQFMASQQAADFSIRAEQNAWSVQSSYSVGGKRWQQLDAFNHIAYVGQVASAWGGADSHVGWDLRDAVSLRAPEGTLDAQMPVLLAIVNSLRETPEYTRQIVELQTRISRGNHEVAMKTIETYRQISQASYNAHQQVNAGIMNSYNERNASQDRGQRGFVNYIHDQQDYADPATNANVTLPASYERVFSNGKGEYVLTNDVSFEPGADWSSIERARH